MILKKMIEYVKQHHPEMSDAEVIEHLNEALDDFSSDTRMVEVGNIPSGRIPFRFKEPVSLYDAQYPYNHVHQTESGHLTEMDDTPGSERLHWMHRTGSYMEMNPNGSVVHKSNQDHHSCIVRDR